MDFPSLKISDGDVCQSIGSLGDWASFALRLGFEHRKFHHPDKRIVTIMCVPTSTLFSILVATGAILADATINDDSNILTWDLLCSLEPGTEVFYSCDHQKYVKYKFERTSDEFGGSVVLTGNKSVKQYVIRDNFSENSIRFKKPVNSRDGSSSEDNIIGFLDKLNIEGAREWAMPVYPTVTLNCVKKKLKENLADLSISYKESSITLSSLLSITENSDRGMGRLLLTSEKNNLSIRNPALAIFSTRYFETLIREFAASNLIIILRSDDYDNTMSTLAKKIRDYSEHIPISLKKMLDTPKNLHVISRLVSR